MDKARHAQESTLPTAGAERLVTLDFVRGVAVLGIVIANVPAMAHTHLAAIWPPAQSGGASAADRLVWLAQFVLIDGKLRGLFTLLFGASMMLFAQRSASSGRGEWLQARRLGWLFVFGLAHLLLLWHGDILHSYALSGLFLLTALHWPAQTKLAFGLMLYLFGSAAISLQHGFALLIAPQDAEIAAANLAANAREAALYSTGSFLDIAEYMTLERSGSILMQTVIYAMVETVPLALIGMGLFEVGLFSGAFAPDRLRRLGWLALLAGGAATFALGLWIYEAGFPILPTFFVFIGPASFPRLAMILGLLALLTAGAPRAVDTVLGQRLVAAGRMAFSNYIGTSLLLVPLFNGWGLALFGKLDRIELLGVVGVVWVLMLLWSKAWLARFRYGPLEWLWRCLTYWRLVPPRSALAIEIDSH